MTYLGTKARKNTSGADFLNLVIITIKQVKMGKAEGCDELFTEALRANPKLMVQALTKLWQKSTEVGHLPDNWQMVLLVPLFKNGSMSEPSSYWPIAVRLHARKVIEAAIALKIRQDYKFHNSQLEIYQGTATETAIKRHVYNAAEVPITAVLDLSLAYDVVPGKKLMEKSTQKNHQIQTE